MRVAAPLQLALLAGVGLLATPGRGVAQTAPATVAVPATVTAPAPPVAAPVPVAHAVSAALPTGFFVRVGAVASSFNPDGLTFRQNDVPAMGPRGMTPGKDFLVSGVLPGVTLGLDIDAAWFYVRVGVDEYAAPNVVRADQDSVRHTTLGWGAAGARLVLGPIALLAGARLGALVVGIAHHGADPAHVTTYEAIDGVYAADLGVQWRPTRWFQLDASVGQDLGNQFATSGSLSVSFGWSRSATPRR